MDNNEFENNNNMSDEMNGNTQNSAESSESNGKNIDPYGTYISEDPDRSSFGAHAQNNGYQNSAENASSDGTRAYRSNPDNSRFNTPGASYSYTQPSKNNKGNGTAIVVIVCISVVACLLFSVLAFMLGGWLNNGAYTPEIPESTTSVETDRNIDSSTDAPETLPDRSDVTLPQVNTVPDEYFNSIHVAANTINSVVEIRTEAAVTDSFFGQYVTQGAGSGVIITEDGFIATNYHVIEGATKIKVKIFSGESYDAVLWGYDIKNDLAVVKIEASGLATATFGNSDNLRYGEHVIAIGNPLGELGNSVSEGVVSAPEREISVEDQMMTLIQIDAAVNPGNSGGGLFNGASELIGIVNAKSTGEEVDNIGFAIPSNTAFPILEDIIQNQSRSEKASLGVRVGNGRNGVYISEITPGSDAERAGLKVNDIILYVDGTRINSSSDLVSLVNTYYVGDKATFVVYRNGKSVDVVVEFTKNAK